MFVRIRLLRTIILFYEIFFQTSFFRRFSRDDYILPNGMRQFFGKKSRGALATVLLLSLILHVIAVIIFGTIKFVSEALREETVFEAAPIETTPQNEPEYQVNIQERNRSAPPQQPETIVANSPSELDIPELNIDVDIESSSVFGRSGGGFGSALDDVRDSAITGNLFGQKITANNLGVVLDVSGSAHAHLDKAIAEIDASFPNAHMVLVVGCGMSDGTVALQGGGGKVPGKPRVIPYSRRSSEGNNNNLERSVPGQLQRFFRGMGQEKREDLKRYFDRRDNLYALYGGDIVATNFAFEHLIDKDVDAIYWFADFADGLNPGIVEDLTNQLQRKRIKVIAHNFLGRNVRFAAKEMAEATGGSTIELVPGQQ